MKNTPLPPENAIRDPDLRAELEEGRGTAEYTDMLRYLHAKQMMRDTGGARVPARPVLDATQVRDADLRKSIQKIDPTDQFGRMVLRNAIDEQQRRDQKAAYLATLTPVTRRREVIRDVLSEPFSDENRYFMHSVLATCGLPYKKPPDGESDYINEYGRSSLVVQAGYLKDHSGKMVKQGLPYGPKARLLLLHICTLALRQNTNDIEVSDSMSAFIREMGFEVTGGKRGTIAQFKEQLHRLAAARMQIGLWRGDSTTTISTQPIEAFEVWLPTHPDQKMLWNTRLIMDEKFFRTLKQHALPVDMRTMRAFAHSAKQIDMVLWLFSRLNQLEKPIAINWATLKAQFGRDIQSRDRKFRQSFAEDWKAIQDVYPQLRSHLTETGIVLNPGDSDIMLVPSKRTLPSRT